MTVSPIVTGASVIGLKFKGGVVVVSDTLLSYGSWRRYRGVDRFQSIQDSTVVCATGEYSDFQSIVQKLDDMELSAKMDDQGYALRPPVIWNWLNRVLYNRRCKMDPLWNSYVVAGYDHSTDTPFLGYTDLYGTRYTDDVVCTGFSSYFGIPKLRGIAENEGTDSLSEQAAIEALRETMSTLAGRDCQGSTQIRFAIITKEGVRYTEAEGVNPNWIHKQYNVASSNMDITGSTW